MCALLGIRASGIRVESSGGLRFRVGFRVWGSTLEGLGFRV